MSATSNADPGGTEFQTLFFLYILDPDGHRIEIYCSDYQTVDPDHEPIKWDLKDPQTANPMGYGGPQKAGLNMAQSS